jgi:hypothetical protein
MARVGASSDRRFGPAPFSTEWVFSPPPPQRPRRVPLRPTWLPPVLPAWFPSERLLSAALVLLLVATTAFVAGSGATGGARSGTRMVSAGDVGRDRGLSAPPMEQKQALGAAPTATVGATEAPAAAEAPAATEAPVEATATAEPTAPVQLAAVPPYAAGQTDGGLLPNYRIVTFYGHPHDENMGILGEYPIEELTEKLREQAAAWEAADPSRPVIPAFEIITTVAQQDPMSDGTYLLDTDFETITEYIDFAEANDMLVFLDLQIGRRGVEAEIDRVLPLLERPNVHLALDPEFAMAEGEQPGEHIGQIDATDVRYAQDLLAGFAAERGLPPKILIIHQFHYTMITNKDQVEPVPGVQLVIHADGHGAPELKAETYGVVITQQQIEFNGFKVFYPQPEFAPDTPLMEPEDILGLDPPPDLVSYQ